MTDAERSELPAGWAISRFEDLVSNGGVFSDGDWVESKDQDPNGDVRLVQLADIGEMRFLNKSRRYMTDEKAHELNCTRLRKGDLLISRLGDPLGKTCIYPANEAKAVTAVDVCILRPSSEGIVPKLFGFFLNGGILRQSINAQASGTTRKRITGKKLKALPVPVPPTNEQERIVEKIETLFARLDKGEEAVREAQKLLKHYRQSILKSAVTGELTSDWRAKRSLDGWRETTMGSVCEFLTSGSRGWAKYYADEGDVFVRAQNLKHDRLELDDVAFVSLPEKSEGKRTQVHKHDLLITITGANVTKSALVEEELGTAYVSQHVALFRPNEEINPEFLYWFVVAKPAGRKQLEGFAYGAGKPGLNLQNIRDVKLVLPPLEEQAEIVDQIRAALSAEEKVEELVAEQLKRSAALRQSILKDAFLGNLVPQDPDDEPASALLERIQQSKKKRK